jgi:ATP-dependent Clp protease ATP-binding subunit ClpA
MFERFTDRARRVIVTSQEEARDLHERFIQPEHLLLALIKEDGVAADALGQAGVDHDAVRAQWIKATAERRPTKRDRPEAGKLPFSPMAKKALELSLREALRLGHNYIGTEHLLLGLLRQADDGGNRIKEVLGIDTEALTAGLSELIASNSPQVSLRSPALIAAMDGARQLAGQGPMTTGHVLTAIMADPRSQGAKALGAFGATVELLESTLAQVEVADTTDAAPGPRAFEIRVGGVSTSIHDPDLAAALQNLSGDQIHGVLKRAFDPGPGQAAAGT